MAFHEAGMRESVSCRGCGRNVVLPAGINRQRARCPKCRTKIEPPPAPVDLKTPDAYEVFLSQSLELKALKPPEPLEEKPPAEVLSLDDARPAEPRRRPPPSFLPRQPAHYPPPFGFRVHVLSDSDRQFRGPFRGVLTPHGLFLELRIGKPLLFIPLGTKCSAEDAKLSIRLPDRGLSLRIVGMTEPEQFATDTAAFLTGRRPVPLPAEYRQPWWLAGIGAVLALGLAAGPIVQTQAAELETWLGLLMAAAFAVVAGTMNTAIAVFTRLATGLKIGLMGGFSAALLALFLIGTAVFLVEDQPAPAPPTSAPIEPAPTETVAPAVPGNAALPPNGESQHSPSHLDLVYRNGQTRLDDGPADVTALAMSPNDFSVVIGYADGSTAIWPLDQPSFEPPRLGPRASGAVRRVEFDSAGKLVLLTGDSGLVISPLAPIAKSPVLIPGEQVVAFLEPNRERFAAVRAGRVQVRYIPMATVRNPVENRATKGFLTTTGKEETLPAGFPMAGLIPPLGGKATVLAWHPTGRLLCGGPDGSLITLQSGGAAMTPITSREHKAPVRAWAVSYLGDFVTGDDEGFIGFWPKKATSPTKFKTGAVGIRGISFNPCGGEIAVVDAAGWISVWVPTGGVKLFEVKQKRATAAIAYGPFEDILMIADGKGVDIWWTPELHYRSIINP